MWLFWAKLGVPVAALLVANALGRGGPYDESDVLLLILAAGRKAMGALGVTPGYVRSASGDILARLVYFEGPGLALAAIMALVLIGMGRRPKKLFLSRGWLGTWKCLRTFLGLGIMLLAFAFFDYGLSWAAASQKTLPLVTALLFAALPAFDEEVRNRAALLSDSSA